MGLATKTAIRTQARQLGFDLVGFTTAAPPPHAGEFQKWLAQGYHGEMQYLARRAAERGDLARLLPGVRSLIAVACNYHAPADPAADHNRPRPGPPGEPVAEYARGAGDYHDWLGARLEQLAAFIRAQGGQAKW